MKILPRFSRFFCLISLVGLIGTVSYATEFSVESSPTNRQPALAYEDAGVSVDWCPSDSAVCRVNRQWTFDELRQIAGDNTWSISQEGDELTFAYRASAGEIFLSGGIQTSLTPVPESDFWVVTLRVQQLDHAILRHWLYTIVDNEQIHFPKTVGVWRGKHAPPAPAIAQPLEGVVKEAVLYSADLNEHRRITYYLPPDYSHAQTYPVVYLTDGDQFIDFGFPQVVEPLIERGAIPPTVLVAVHAAPFTPTHDRRAEEYQLGVNAAAYNAHEAFFTKAVRSWAESELNVSRDPGQRALAGYSRGAVFAGNTGIRQPDIYGHVMMFSPGAEPQIIDSSKTGTRYYLLAGTLEEHFYDVTQQTFWNLLLAKIEVVFNRRIAGHASTMWVEELPRALTWMFRSE